jgi:hypothetical protein
MKLRAVIPALLIATVAQALAKLPEDLKRQFDEAERRIVRLPPSAFPELPRNVIKELQRRGCSIPQEAFSKKLNNVIKGQFARPGELDWAVLCSIKGVSTILVFWNGSEKNPAAIAPFEDRIFLQGITDEKIGYSREITPVGKDFIVLHARASAEPTPPLINHQGLDDAFIEKASSTWYFYDHNWLKLAGSD